jgi:hypothetical protein
MEILISLLLIVLIWVLMTFYLIITLYVVINVLKFVKALFTTMPGKGYKKRFREKLPLNIKTFLPKKRFIQIIVAMALINIGLYGMSRYSWIDNDEALHVKAKHYLVAGDVLSRQMEVANIIFHPDSYKMRPLVWLLHGIYNLGAQYLPDDDAEKAMWYYRFFIYPYAQKDILPYSNLAVKEYFRPWMPHFVGRVFYEFPLLGEIFFYNEHIRHNHDYLVDETYREPHIRFLKKSFELLETLSTKPIEDKNMYRAYLQAYPGFAHFYTLKQGYYHNGENMRSAFFQESWYIEQDKKELEWYLKFEKLFDNPKIQKIYGKQLAKSKVLLYCAILNITEDLIEITHIDGTFICKGEPMKTYVRVRNLLVGEDGNKAPLLRSSKYKELKQLNASQGKKGGVLFELSNQEIDTLYFSYISGYGGMYKHIGKNVCGYTVYGNVYESPDHMTYWEKGADKSDADEYHRFLEKINKTTKTGEKQ